MKPKYYTPKILILLSLLCSAHIARAVTYELKNSFHEGRYVWATCWMDKERTAAPQGYGEPTESYSSLEEYQNGLLVESGCKVVTVGPGTWHGFARQEVDDAPSIDTLLCGVGYGFVAACPDDHVLWLRSNQKFQVRVANGSPVEAYTIGQASSCSYPGGGSWLGCTLSANGISVAVGMVETVRSCTPLTIDQPFICRPDDDAATSNPSTSAPNTQTAGSPPPSAAEAQTQVGKYLTIFAGFYFVMQWMFSAS